MRDAGRRSDAAVEGHGDLHEDEGALVLDPFGEAFVEAAGFGFADAEGGFDAGGAQCFHAVAGDVGVGVGGGGDYAGDSGGDEGLGAGAGAAGVVAGLESDVGGAAAEAVFFVVLCGVFEGGDFGVVEEVVFVPAFADEFAGAVEDDAAYSGVGRGEADAAAGQFEGALHPVGVVSGGGHCRMLSSLHVARRAAGSLGVYCERCLTGVLRIDTLYT